MGITLQRLLQPIFTQVCPLQEEWMKSLCPQRIQIPTFKEKVAKNFAIQGFWAGCIYDSWINPMPTDVWRTIC